MLIDQQMFGQSGAAVFIEATGYDTNTLTFTTTAQLVDVNITVTDAPDILWTWSDDTTSTAADPGTKDFGTAATRVHTLYVSDWSLVKNVDFRNNAGLSFDLFHLFSKHCTGNFELYLTDIYGDIGNLPASLTGILRLFGTDVTGDIGNLPSGLTGNLDLHDTDISGDTGNLPTGLTGDLLLQNTVVTGDIGNLPTGVTARLFLYNTDVTGDIGNLPTGLTGELRLYDTVVTGDIGNLPTGLTSDLQLYNTDVSTYTPGTWPCATGNGKNLFFQNLTLSQTSVDGILVDLDAHGNTSCTLNLSGGTNAVPSATGLAAKTNLEGKGWTVTVNS